MPRGGRRSGQAGKAYSNRSDLNPAANAAKVNRNPRVRAPEGVPTQGLQQAPGAAQQPGPVPGAAGAFTRPTDRPNEPITAGMPMGAGPGPEGMPPVPGGGALDELRILYMRFPYPELRELIEEMMGG
jgi:hypothetical protein